MEQEDMVELHQPQDHLDQEKQEMLTLVEVVVVDITQDQFVVLEQQEVQEV